MIAKLGAALLLSLGLLTACGGNTTPQPGQRSGTGIFVSDIHFNPLADGTLTDRLARAPAAQWDSILAGSTQTAYRYFPAASDTNFPLLRSLLAAMRQQAPAADIVFVSGDSLAHGLPQFFNKFATNPSPAAYATFANIAEQYVAMKLAQTFPNAQIVPALGDWDTPCDRSNTFPGAGFLASFSSAWNPAVNRHGGAPSFQGDFATGGYYSTAFPIDPRGRLIVLDTEPWSNGYNANACEAGGENVGAAELAWLEAQLDDARSSGRRVWILGHIPPGIGVAATACPSTNAPFYADAYASTLNALFVKNRDILTLGIFGHEHMDDYRLLQDSSGPVFGLKIVPSVSPLDGNNPAFVRLTYDPNAGVITDTATWYLTNFSTASTTVPGLWRYEYNFDTTYGQIALDTGGIAGAVGRILTQPSAQTAFARYYPSSASVPAAVPFPAYGCALNNVAAVDYAACACPT
jgi:hypothetical protein